MYKNIGKMMLSVSIWGVLATFGFLSAMVTLGILTDAKYTNRIDNPMRALYAVMFLVGSALVCIFWKKFMNFGLIGRMNDIFMADDDGYVPLEDLSKELGMSAEKILPVANMGIRKGYMINLNYNATDKVFLLSDKLHKPNYEFAGVGIPENKPFIGIHCPGCAASLKIRSNTRGVCPYCGREIIAPEYAPKED